KRITAIFLTCIIIFTTVFVGIQPDMGHTAPAYDFGFYYGQENIRFEGDLRPSGLKNPDDRYSTANWHQNILYNMIAKEEKLTRDDIQFDIKEDTSRGDKPGQFSRISGYHVLRNNRAVIEQLASEANGN